MPMHQPSLSQVEDWQSGQVQGKKGSLPLLDKSRASACVLSTQSRAAQLSQSPCSCGAIYQ